MKHQAYSCCIILVLLCQSMLFGQAPCVSSEWLNRTPTGENLYAAYADTGKTILAGNSGLVLRLSDRNNNKWDRIYVPFDSLLDDIAFTSPNIGFMVGRAADFKGIILKTTDAGWTWNQILGDTAAGELTSIHFPNPQVGYAAGQWGKMLKSVDGGNSWSNLPFPISTQITDVHFTSVDTGWVAASGLFKTVDGGLTWAFVPSSNLPVKTVKFWDSQMGVAGGNNGGTVYTQNGGQSWTYVNVGTVFNTRDIVLMDSGTCIIVGGAVLAISRNHGVSYTTSSLNTNPTGNLLYCGAATDSGDVYLGGDDGFIGTSGNYGYSFYPMSSQGLLGDAMGVWFTTPMNGYVAASGTGSAILRTIDGGDSWQMNTNLSGVSVHFPSVDTGYVVGGTLTIRRTTNAGATWTTMTPGWVNNNVIRVWFLTGTTGLIFSSQGTIRKTTDMGASWVQVLAQGTSNNVIRDVHFLNDFNGYAAGLSLFRTMNGGNNWVTTSVPFPSRSVHFLTDSIGFLGATTSHIAKTTDAGTTWTTVVLPTDGNAPSDPVVAIEFVNPMLGFAASGGGEGVIWITTDGGNTWPIRHLAMTKPFFDLHVIDSSEVIAVGFRGAIMRLRLGATEPVFGAAVERCGPGAVELAADGEGLIRWFDSPTATLPIAFGDTLRTSYLSQSDTFYLENHQGFCESGRLPYPVVIHPIPAAPVSSDTAICGSGTVTLQSNCGLDCHWFTDTTIAPVATGATYSTTVAVPGQRFFVASVDGQCRGPFTEVQVTAMPLPAVSPITGPTTVQSGQTIQYTSTVPAGTTPIWQITNGAGASASDSLSVTWGTPGTGGLMLTLVDSMGCINTTTLNVTINTAISAAEALPAAHLRVHPNPSSGVLGLQLAGGEPGLHWLRVMDANGRLVFERSLSVEADELYEFQLDDLPNGLYMIRLEGDSRGFTQKWCIQR